MVKKYTCSNGLAVVVDEMPQMHSASVGVWIGVGGRYETPAQVGLSHFLEHIVFKGTHSRSCQEIKESIEGIGGALNAYTSKEYTCFYAKVLAQDCLKAVDVLSDMVFRPLFDPKDIEQEKDVIVEEIKMYLDSPAQLVHDHLDEILWPDHPMSYCLTGSENNVREFQQQDFKDFAHNYYCPHNIVIAVAGNVDAENVFQRVEKAWGQLEQGKPSQPLDCSEDQAPFRIQWTTKDIEQAHVAMAFYAYEREHPLRYAAGLLNIILGGNMSSRLFKELREERGLAYDVRSSTYRYSDVGTFEISAGLEPHKVKEMLKVTWQELQKAQQTQVSTDELERARAYYKGRLQMAMEKTAECMSWCGEELLMTGRMRELGDVLQEIDRVEVDDIQKVAQDIFCKQRFSLAGIAPVDATDSVYEVLNAL